MSDQKSYDEAKQEYLESLKQESASETIDSQQTPNFKSVGLKTVDFDDKSSLRSIHAERINKEKSSNDTDKDKR